MIELLGAAIREGFGVVIACLIPLLAVAAVAAILIGLLGGALGVRDAALAQIVRALAVVLALGLLAQGIAASTLEFTSRTWAELGSAQPPAEPEP